MRNFDQFVAEMNLSKQELDTFEKYINKIEKVAKNPVEFMSRGSMVFFTPEAVLAVAVVKFAYDLYKDYKKSWLEGIEVRDPEFELQVKNFVQELNRVESQPDIEAAGLDTYARLRNSILSAKNAAMRARSQGQVY